MSIVLVKSKLPAEKRLELVHVSLMREKTFAFFAGLFMVGRTTITEAPITAATNGRDVLYGREFVDGLTDKELAFLVLHENMHKCYRHLTTWRNLYDKNSALANVACDHVINIQLKDMDQHEKFIAMPIYRDGPKRGQNMGCLDERFRGMDAKQVFDILEKEQQQNGGGGGGFGGDEISDSESDSSGGHGNDQGGLDDHDWEGAQQLSAEEKKQLAQDIEGALRQGGIYAGKVGGNLLREVQEMIEPKVDWRDALRRFIRVSLKDRDQPSWRRAHRNYLWQDVILPSIMGKRMKHLVVMFDASGSIQGEMLNLFMGELNKVISTVNPDRIDVLYWDTEVAGHETYKGGDKKDLVHRTKPRGGGGTDPDCLPPFIAQKGLNPDAFIVLTDGYMSSDSRKWAAISKPVLWCIIGNERFAIPKGQVVNVKD